VPKSVYTSVVPNEWFAPGPVFPSDTVWFFPVSACQPDRLGGRAIFEGVQGPTDHIVHVEMARKATGAESATLSMRARTIDMGSANLVHINTIVVFITSVLTYLLTCLFQPT